MASCGSFARNWRGVTFGEQFQKAMKGGVLVVAAPMCRKAQVARPYPVAQFAINQTGKAGADIGFNYLPDPELHADKAFDNSPTDVVALHSRTVPRHKDL